MAEYSLQRETIVRKPIAEVFDFFSRAENLVRLTPPWLNFRILTPLPIEMRAGATIAYKLRVRGFPVTWRSEIAVWNPPFEFVDVQLQGPYQSWHHTHRFSELENGTRIEDVVRYSLPFGLLGDWANRLLVASDLDKIFTYRGQEVRRLFALS